MKKKVSFLLAAVFVAAAVWTGLALPSASAANVFTVGLFKTSYASLDVSAAAEDGGMGLLARARTANASVALDRRLCGVFDLEFGILEDNGAAPAFSAALQNESPGAESSSTELVFRKGANGYTVSSGGKTVQIADASRIRLRFDPAARAITLDGAAVGSVGSVWREYSFGLRFSAPSGNGGAMLYYINGHSLAQAVIPNAYGPSVFADFSVKAVIDSPYILPEPNAFDLLDGPIANINVEVLYRSAPVLTSRPYTAGLSFTPAYADGYTVNYSAQDSAGKLGSAGFAPAVTGPAAAASTTFTFDARTEDRTLGVGSSIALPYGSVANKDLTDRSMTAVLTVKKDGQTVQGYDKAVCGPDDRFTFSQAGAYEFIYTAPEPNVPGAKSFTVTASASQPAAALPKFNAYYLVGEAVKIPAVSMALNGLTLPASSVVYAPDGRAFAAAETVLNLKGVYTVEYRAFFADKIYTVRFAFTVYDPAYSVTGGDSRAYYGVSPYDPGREGVAVELSQGQEFRFSGTVDLTGKRAGDPIVDIDVLSQKAGVADFVRLEVTFTDVHDSSNTVTVSVRKSIEDNYMAYLQAGCYGQARVGWEQGNPDRAYVEPSIWGAYTTCTFNGAIDPTGKVINTFSVSFDYEARVIYVNQKLIVDLSDSRAFDNLWTGFTTGEAYVSVRAEEYTAMTARFLLTRAGSNDLRQSVREDTVPPEISADTQGYGENALPAAEVGRPYKLFPASADDKECGSAPVNAYVYYAYGSTASGRVNVTDGAFTPFRSGVYTIVYRSSDLFGNTAEKLLRVTASAALPALGVGVGAPGAGPNLVGHPVPVPAASATGASGNAVLTAVARHKTSGAEYPVTGGTFIPYAAGVYAVTYTATDYIGRTASAVSADIAVADDGKPVFTGEASLPFVFIADAEYTLPELYAYSYASGAPVAVKAALSVTDGAGTREVADGKYTPSGTAAVLTYTATAGGSGSKSYSIPIQTIRTGSAPNYAYDMRQLFLTSAAVESNAANVTLVASAAGDTSVRFIKPLLAAKFEFEFESGGVSALSAAGRIDVYLTDSADPSVRVKVSFIKNGDGISLSVGDGKPMPSVGSFTGASTYRPLVKYDAAGLKFKDAQNNGIKAVSTVSGAPFTGFPSGMVWLEFVIADVSGSARLALRNIGGQRLTNSAADNVSPGIDILGDYGGSYELGSTAVLPRAIALDILNLSVTFTMTVRGPDNSVLLDAVDPGREYSIPLSMTGAYQVRYTAVDSALPGRPTQFSYAITVPDRSLPELSIAGAAPETAVAGKTVTLPAATASKNGTAIEVYVYITDPFGVIKKLDKNAAGKYDWTPLIRGAWSVEYFTVDAAGNTAERRVAVTVS